MTRRTVLFSLAALLLVSMAAISSGSSAVRAEDGAATPSATPGDDLDVRIEVTGVIESVTPQNQSVSIVLLTDGTSILVNPASQGAGDLEAGQTITVIASMDDDDEQLVAKIITIVVVATEEPTAEPTMEPTAEPTAEPTMEPTQPATPPATAQVTCGGPNQHPVATRLADAFGVSYDEVMGWHCKGYGFGEIAKAYLLAEKTGKTPDEFFEMRASGKGWGQIVKDADVKPNELAPGLVIKGKKNGTATATVTAEASGDQTQKPGNGNGNGSGGKSNGNGKDKNNGGKSNGNGKGKK
jgi:uncharacterized membrane protein YgcG